jgi:formate hydrogenlyase subunit 3/multisubunit Na+/H+ antiporter MnhD subunit
MNPLIPLFVAIPLTGAFLDMILGRFIKGFSRYFTSVVLLALASMSIYSAATTGTDPSVYNVGGWEPVLGIPVGISMVMDGFTVPVSYTHLTLPTN